MRISLARAVLLGVLLACMGLGGVAVALAQDSPDGANAAPEPATAQAAPVDPAATDALTLKSTENEFLAPSSSEVPVSIPQDPEDPVTMQTPAGALHVTPVDVAPGADEGTLQSDSTVAYADTAKDASTLVQAQPDGIEIFTEVATPAAPTDFSWKVDLDGEEQLVANADGSVSVVDPTPARGDEKNVVPASAADVVIDGEAPGMGTVPEPLAATDAPEQIVTAPPGADVLRPEELDPTPPVSAVIPDPQLTDSLKDGLEQASQEVAGPGGDAAAAGEQIQSDMAQAVDDGVRVPSQVTVATIAAPTASDAEGDPVPAALTVDGDTITLHVTHDQDTAYPVMADPLVTIQDYAMVTHAAPFGVVVVGAVNGSWAIRNAPSAVFGLDRWGNVLYAVNLWGTWYLVYDFSYSPAAVAVAIDVYRPPWWAVVVWRVWRSYDHVGSHQEFRFDARYDCGDTGGNGYLSACAADVSNPDDIAGVDDDPNVTLDDDGQRAGVQAASVYSGKRYRVTVSGGGWTTIRSRYQSYVIGNVRHGAHMDALGAKQGWRAGEVGGSWNWGCGWVRVKNTLSSTGPAKTHCNSDWQPKIGAYALSLNCKRCTHGQSVAISPGAGAVTECLNVFPNSSGTGACETASDVPQLTAAQTRNGYHVSWRYLTNDGKYVLVNDAHNPSNHGRWLYIRRSAFGKLPATPAAEDHK